MTHHPNCPAARLPEAQCLCGRGDGSLYISGYCTDRWLDGIRVDPETGKVFNIHDED